MFATGYAKTNQARALAVQIDMFRRFGLGKFDNLLVELSKDPAMIIWLDNQDNHKDAINENFGREILELFSLGIGNYSEEDIKECSRAFTGWTLKNAEYMSVRAMKDSIWPYGRISWHFDYRDHDHDDGHKTFLGETGNLNGEDIIRIIAKQSAAAEFICRHLYDFFVADEEPVPQWSYTPPKDQKAIGIMSDTYLESGYNITEVLRVMFKSDFFKYSSYERVKCPAEYVAGCLRVSGIIQKPTLFMNSAVDVMEYMGHTFLNPPSVEGWHTGIEWINSGSLMRRTNFFTDTISITSRPGIKKMVAWVRKQEIKSAEEFVDVCLSLFGPLEIDKPTHEELTQHVNSKGVFENDRLKTEQLEEKDIIELLQLIVSLREYQFA